MAQPSIRPEGRNLEVELTPAELAKEIVDRMALGLDVNEIAAELTEKFTITKKK